MKKSTYLLIVILLIISILISGCGKTPGDKKNYENPNDEQNNEQTSACGIIDGFDKSTHQYSNIDGVNPSLLSLDVYTPRFKESCKSKLPIMIYVHGGGWQKGDKENPTSILYKAPYFTKKGYAYISVNYRLSPAVMYPVHNQDAANAIKWVYDNADSFNGDTSKITLMGHSAGGGIISAISTDEKYLKQNGLSLNILKCAVSLDTQGYDISRKVGIEKPDELYVTAFGTNPEVWKDASPINHISAGKGIPSFFIVTRGRNVRVQLAREFEGALKSAGVLTELLEAKGLTHEEAGRYIGDPSDSMITPIIQKFLDANCAS